MKLPSQWPTRYPAIPPSDAVTTCWPNHAGLVRRRPVAPGVPVAGVGCPRLGRSALSSTCGAAVDRHLRHRRCVLLPASSTGRLLSGLTFAGPPRTSPRGCRGPGCRGSSRRRPRWHRACRSKRKAGRSLVAGASWLLVDVAHVMKLATPTTCPVSYMAPCQMPHSSAQRTVNWPSWPVVRGVGDVVVVGVGVRLHPQLVGPETVDHVQRRHVEGDGRVGRYHQVAWSRTRRRSGTCT